MTMQINFRKIIEQSGEKLSLRQLAKEMTDKGLFKNLNSAYSMLMYHQSGKAKSVDFLMLEYLKERFNLTETQILN